MGNEAEQVVRMMLNGTEVVIRITGRATMSLAAYLVAYARKHKGAYQKSDMMRLLTSGDRLVVFTMTKKQYRDFDKAAEKCVDYAPFINRKEKDGMVSLIVSERTLPIVNAVLDEIGYVREERQEEQEVKKKREMSSDSSKSSPEKNMEKQNEKGEKMSVIDMLKRNREIIKGQKKKKEIPELNKDLG